MFRNRRISSIRALSTGRKIFIGILFLSTLLWLRIVVPTVGEDNSQFSSSQNNEENRELLALQPDISISDDDQFLTGDYVAPANSFNYQLEGEPSSWQMTSELSVSLILVIGFIYLVVIGLNWLRRRDTFGVNNSKLAVIETTGLAPGRLLHLVAVGDRLLLIGTTNKQLVLLTELDNNPLSVTDTTPTFAEVLSEANKPPISMIHNWETAFDNLRVTLQQAQDVRKP